MKKKKVAKILALAIVLCMIIRTNAFAEETNVSDTAVSNVSDTTEATVSDISETNVSETTETNESATTETNVSDTTVTNVSDTVDERTSNDVIVDPVSTETPLAFSMLLSNAPVVDTIPTINSVTASPTGGWVKGPVNVSISATASTKNAETQIFYKVGEGSNWSSISIGKDSNTPVIKTITVNNEGNNSFYCYAKCSNLISDTKSIVLMIDNTAPIITLNGASTVKVPVYESYTELGATATDNYDKNLTVTAAGTVDTDIVGTYTITYTVSDTAGNKATVTRTVNVVDEIAPVITLNGASTVKVPVYESYTELGATATDNYDKNLTVTVTGSVDTDIVGTYTITYTVSDSSGHEASVTRTVNVVDEIAPVITLNGPSTVKITVGGSYTELGATVTDNYDKNLIVTVSGTVDTAKVGTYVITYSVSDSSGNAATMITRTVKVVYEFGGILEPINAKGNSLFKAGSTVPVKFQLKDAKGKYITTATATITFTKFSDSVLGNETEAVSTSAATTGNAFRYDSTSNQYIFNMNTKGLTSGSYWLTVTLDDKSSYNVQISLK